MAQLLEIKSNSSQINFLTELKALMSPTSMRMKSGKPFTLLTYILSDHKKSKKKNPDVLKEFRSFADSVEPEGEKVCKLHRTRTDGGTRSLFSN